ncbi:MAG: right-handed parallel beta-helix repeat-containing protein [Myxococcota bacterium]
MRIASLFFCLSALVSFPLGAMAVDGVIEINDNRAVAGSVTPGDTGGYPVSITVAGSYRLTSDLSGIIAVSSGVGPVEIDLNGFTVDGGGQVGSGINGALAGAGMVVRNGVVRNFTVSCVRVGDEGRVDRVLTEDCQTGISTGVHSIVTRSHARDHTLNGVSAGIGSRVSSTVTEGNTGDGVQAGARSVTSQTLTRGNNSAGLDLGSESVSFGNVVAGNGVGIALDSRSVADGNTIGSSAGGGLSAGDDVVLVRNNASDNDAAAGILCNGRCVVKGNLAANNTGIGIGVDDGANVVANTSSNNTLQGFSCSGGSEICHFVGNTAIANGGSGLVLDAASLTGSYKDNTFNSNSGSDVNQTGRDPGFLNNCSGTVPCP